MINQVRRSGMRGLGWLEFEYLKYIPKGYYVPEGAGRVTWPTCPTTGKPATLHTLPWGDNIAICPKPAAPEVVYLAPGGGGASGPYPLKVTFKYPYQEWPPLSIVNPTLPGLVPASSDMPPVYQYPTVVQTAVPTRATAPTGEGFKFPDISSIPIWIWLVGALFALMYFKK